MKRSSLFLMSALVLILAACGTDPNAKIKERAHYWQRTNASDQAYIVGPKAQQMLDRDIGRCVVELRELERLGIIKDAIPTDMGGHVLSREEFDLSKWDTPERNGDLLNEHLPYTNFEDCMADKGWERVQTIPFKVAAAARENYLKTHGLYGTAKKEEKARQDRENYGNLND